MRRAAEGVAGEAARMSRTDGEVARMSRINAAAKELPA